MAVAPRLASPTAMQNRAVAHDTAARVRLCGTGAGRATRAACQARPFQRAAIGRGPGGPRACRLAEAGHGARHVAQRANRWAREDRPASTGPRLGRGSHGEAGSGRGGGHAVELAAMTAAGGWRGQPRTAVPPHGHGQRWARRAGVVPANRDARARRQAAHPGQEIGMLDDARGGRGRTGPPGPGLAGRGGVRTPGAAPAARIMMMASAAHDRPLPRT